MAVLFSIITVTRNNLDGLKETCESIKSQDFKDFEWIVMDGASHDETAKWLSEVKDVKWISEHDFGIYDAMNKGMKMACGKYLIFMNAGDKFAKTNVLSAVSAQAKDKNPDFIYGDSIEGTGDNSFYKKAKPLDKISQGMPTHHQAMIYNAASLGELTYNTNIDLAADYDLTARFLTLAKRNALYVPIPICIFKQGGTSQVHAAKSRAQEFEIRSSLGLATPIENMATWFYQTVAWNIRKSMPRVYIWWKNSRK